RLISDAHDGEPAGRKAGAIATHLRACPACRRFQQTAGVVGDQVREIAGWQPPARPELRRGAVGRVGGSFRSAGPRAEPRVYREGTPLKRAGTRAGNLV